MKTYLNAKSIHIYGWSFFIREEQTAFEEKLRSKGWMQKEMDYRRLGSGSMETLKQTYMLEQYLSSGAKDLFIKNEHNDCCVYTFDLDPFGEGTTYIYRIQKGKKHYDLLLESIELHVYKYGMGILFMRTLNMDPNTTIKDIKIINEKGRSISIPFLPEEDGYILCPDSLAIIAQNKDGIMENEKLKTDFRKRIKNVFDANTEENRRNLGKQAEFLEYVLNNNLDGIGKNDLVVEPISDYRMFVMALIRDTKLSEKIADKTWRESGEGIEKLYTIVCVDEKEATCQNEKMRRDILDNASYERWVDCGTLYGMTNYSFVCVTSEAAGINSSVVRPFYAEYIYIVSLVLAQRVALMMFFDRAEQLATQMFRGKKTGKLINRRDCKELIDLQEKYIEFQNSMMILEVSCQEQGIELYRLLQKQLLIEEERFVLDEQLKGLYEIVNVSNGTRSSWWGLVWAIVAIVIAIPTLIIEGSSVVQTLLEFLMK